MIPIASRCRSNRKQVIRAAAAATPAFSAPTCFCLTVTAMIVMSCGRSEHAKDGSAGARTTAREVPRPTTCPPAPGGIVVGFDKIAYFPARAPASELQRLCPAVGDTLYDAVGWQANGRKFPFVGAMVVAIPHQGSSPDS